MDEIALPQQNNPEELSCFTIWGNYTCETSVFECFWPNLGQNDANFDFPVLRMGG